MALTKVHNRMVAGSVANVLDYGAVADGVTDDSTAIQAAINSGKKTIVIPAGEYYLASQLTVSANGINIYGEGGGMTGSGTVLKGGHTGRMILVNPSAAMNSDGFFSSATGSLIRGFHLRDIYFISGSDDAAQPDTQYGVEIRSAFEGINIHDCSFRGFTKVNVFLNNVWNARITGVTVRGLVTGSVQVGEYGFLGYNANSCYVENCYAQYIPAGGSGFRFINADSGTLIASQADSTANGVWISNNGDNRNIGQFSIDQFWSENLPAYAASTVGGVISIDVTSGGSGYTSAPTVNIGTPASGGVQAVAYANISSGAVTSVDVYLMGSNYTSVPSISFSGGGGTGANATAKIMDIDANSDICSSTILFTDCGGGSVRQSHFIAGGGTVNSHAYIYAYNTRSVAVSNNLFAGSGNGCAVFLAAARENVDRFYVDNLNFVRDTAGFYLTVTNEYNSTNERYFPVDNEFGSIVFDDQRVWIPASAFTETAGTVTFKNVGSTGALEFLKASGTSTAGVTVGIPSTVNNRNTRVIPYVHYYTTTAAGNLVNINCKPLAIDEGDAATGGAGAGRQAPESASANALVVHDRVQTANWGLDLTGDTGDRTINMAIGRTVDGNDTCTGDLYILGVDLLFTKHDWRA